MNARFRIRHARLTRNLLISGVVLVWGVAGRLLAVELRASISGANLALSWDQDATHEFYLQVRTNLTDAAGWRVDANSSSLVGGQYSATVDASGPQRFYRLKSWEVLFDGTSLAGFRGYRQVGLPTTGWFITSAGELQTVSGPQSHILTTNQYDDFELVWEWKTATGGNGGVLYRVTEYYDQPYKSAPEYQLFDDTSYSQPESQNLGAVYALLAPTNKVAAPVGLWNQCRLIVQGNQVEHWLNGRRIVQYELNSPAFNALVASSQFSPYASQFGKAAKGYIAFQNWSPEIWYRNIKIRSLAPE